MKIIAYYLPQFHEIEENNRWWGNGYTEWTCLKKAKQQFKGHRQPRIPLNNNYYDLTNPQILEWQATLANKYGIYGFCIYHYWFDGKKLLQKPLELLLKNKHISINYCICWANEDWTNGWVSNRPDTLIKQTYGDQSEWLQHFMYLLPFFKDERYIKIDGKPLLVLYHPEQIPQLGELLNYWNELMIKNSFNGLTTASQHPDILFNDSYRNRQYLDYQIEYQPDLAALSVEPWYYYFYQKMNRLLDNVFITRYFSNTKFMRPLILKNYKKTWDNIISTKPADMTRIPGAFVDWDNTPRKGKRGSIYTGVTPELFESYMKAQILNARNEYKKSYIFLFAWNEWSEGGYLEPDTFYGFSYLEAIRQALKLTNEWEGD